MADIQASIKIQGLTALQRTFGNLPKSVQNKAMRPALRKGGSVVAKAASANVKAVTGPEATGLLEKNIKVYSFKKYRGLLRVGVMVKKGLMSVKGVRVGLYAGVLEYGKKNQPPRSWIRKAARESTGAAFSAIADEADKRMKSAVEAAKK